MCKMFRICVSFIILAVIVSRAATRKARVGNKVILGTTHDIMMSLQDSEQQDKNTESLITSIVQSNRILNQSYVVIHYETELGSSAELQTKQFLRLLLKVEPTSRIFLTIRISGPTDLSTYGNEYLNLLNDLNIQLEGISIELKNIDAFCTHNVGLNLTGKTKASLKSFKRFSNTKVGYVLDLNNVYCTFLLENMGTADFIIVKVSLQRNDNIFVESYGAFKVNIESHIKSAESFLQQFNTTDIYYQLVIKSELIVAQNGFKLDVHGNLTYDSKGETEIKNIKNNTDALNILVGSAYQHLLTQYCLEWILHNQAGINAIISYQYASNVNTQVWDHVTVIPYFMVLPINCTTTKVKLQLPQSVNLLFQDVRDSGFNTIMTNGDQWQELSKGRDDYLKPCVKLKCRPENVIYFNNQQYAFENQSASEIQKLAYISDMKLTTLVFSTYYREGTVHKWTNIVDIIKREGKLVSDREQTCTEQFDFFKNIRTYKSCNNTCHALTFKNLTGCRSLKINSQNIMWRGIIQIENYNISYFVENILKRLDSLVIARQLLRKMYDQPMLPVFLRIVFNHTKKPSPNENKLYCSPFYNQVYQYYEIILTWAKIHAFPIIIDPSANLYKFINPISWQPLTSSRSEIINELMTSSPLFIRRSYNLSTVFGPEWTTGMYPCLQQVEDVGSLNDINFNHEFAGVTINMDLRNNGGSLTSLELKLIMLFSLRKFDVVEIILLTENHVQTLLNVLTEPNFDMVLKQNNIQNKKFYLQVSSYQHKIIDGTITQLQQLDFQVHFSDKIAQELDRVAGNDNIILGTVQENCIDLAYKLVHNKNDTFLKIFSTNISYLVCETYPTSATNNSKKTMQEYLETHLYIRKLFQYFYPNLKEVRFRLHPLVSDKTTNTNEMLFLADVNNFAKGHQVHYFMLPVLPQENTTEFQQSSFWTVKSYQDLSDPSVYQEKLAAVLNVTAWTPVPSWVPPTTNSTSPKKPQEFSSFIIYIVVAVASIASFVVTLLVIMKVRRSNSFLSEKEVKDFFYGKMETLEKAVNERKLYDTVKKSRHVYNGLVYQKDCEISKNEINIDRKGSICTSSKFSSKFRVKLHNNRDGEVIVEVCSKKCPKDKFKAWLSEVKMLCYVGSHNNIVGFMGCYTSEIRKGVLWVITEFCQEGSLENHLKTFEDTINVDELVRFGCEIAIGMEYISSQNIIHGDLRARHVYLDEHKVCKVGDFGLSRKLLQYKAVVKKGKRERLPWRWMPCEALQHLEFSVYSDVWSYGVTLWEIFSLGDLPYGEDEIFSQTFVAQVMKGKRLLCPSQATPEIYDKMQECWTLDPEMRSEFTDLVKSFSSMLTSRADVQ